MFSAMEIAVTVSWFRAKGEGEPIELSCTVTLPRRKGAEAEAIDGRRVTIVDGPTQGNETVRIPISEGWLKSVLRHHHAGAGGRARAQKLSSERRRDIARAGGLARARKRALAEEQLSRDASAGAPVGHLAVEEM